MEELRRLWCLLDTNNISLMARYIISAAHVWADKLSRHLDNDDWRRKPVLVAELDVRFGRHSIDRFASALDTLLYPYNARWRDPTWTHSPHHGHLAQQQRTESTIRRYFDLCEEQRLAPLAATSAHMGTLRRVARATRHHQGLESSTLPIGSQRPIKDHGLEVVGLGDLVAKVRKGLAASHVAIDDTLVRVNLLSSFVVKALRMPQALRLRLTEATTRAALQASLARYQVRLLRVCTTVVLLYLFFIRGGSGIDCLT
jgi:hypothetical protein